MASEQYLSLGKIHWYLLNAQNLMGEKTMVPHEVGKLYTPQKTEFGKEVENDEINWWVFKRETNITELKLRTEKALRSADILKAETKSISQRYFQSFQKLLNAYDTFLLKHAEDIQELLNYIQWLYQKDEMAPTILFTYRTWGSTRRSDRFYHIEAGDLENTERLKELAEIVLGIKKDNLYILNTVRSEMEYEIYSNWDSDDPEPDPVSESVVETRAAHEATDRFAEFFEQLRDSLRNIVLDIGKKQKQERIFSSDEFWRNFIIKVKDSNKAEQLWDYKKTLSMLEVLERNKKREAEHKFAELVAAFANAQGGVIIVGITDTPPRKIEGIGLDTSKIERNIQNIRRVIREYINYDPDFVHIQQVEMIDESGSKNMCLVIAIRQTFQPIEVKGTENEPSFTYPLRSESGLSRVDRLTIQHHKIGIKSDNFNFLSRLQQILYESL